MTVLVPLRPGTDISFASAPEVKPAVNAAETVAVPITHDWGPINQVVACEDFEAFTEIFGESATAGRTAVASAFDGQGLPGAGGAGTVLVYRQAAAEALAASVQLKNSTPAMALKLTAKYAGTRGNSISASIAADVAEPTKNICKILFNGAVVATYVYPKTNIKLLAEEINATEGSPVTAVAEITGVELTATAGTSLAGGNNGSTLINANYVSCLEALKFEPFSVLAFQNLTSSEILATTLSWLSEMVEKDRPVRLVVGGQSADTMAEAIARTAALESDHVINLGVGTYLDSLVNETLSTAQLAPRVAGALASLGMSRSLTFARFGSLSIVTAPNGGELEEAINNGVTAFSEAIASDATVKIELAQTTYTTKTNPQKLFAVFSDPRCIAIMDNYVRNMKQWGDENSIGATINEDTIAAVKSKGVEEQTQLEKQELIVPGSGFFEITSPQTGRVGTGKLRQAIVYKFGWAFEPTNLHLIGQGSVS